MKVEELKIEHNSEEWYEARKGIATASSFKNIITKGLKKSTSCENYAAKLALESLYPNIEEDTFQSVAMQRGHDLEDIARDAYIEKTWNEVEDSCFFKINELQIGASPDGVVTENGKRQGLLEIKCMSGHKHLSQLISDDIVDSTHWIQVQGQLLVSGFEWCDYVSFHPEFNYEERLRIIRVNKCEDFKSKFLQYLNIANAYKADLIQKYREKKNGK